MEAERNPNPPLGAQPATHALNYASAISHHRSLRHVLLVVATIGLTLIAWKTIPTLYTRLALMHLQRVAFSQGLSSDAVVFDTSSSAMPGLNRSDPNFVSKSMASKKYVAYLPNDWVRFASKVGTWKGLTALIFAGRLQDAAGNTHLVSIEAFDWYTDGSRLVVAVREYSLGGLRAEPREMTTYTDYPEIHVWSNTRILAGRFDPTHPDRVTFDVIQSGDRQTWTMRLQNNQFIFDHHDDNTRFDPDAPRGTLDGFNQAPRPSPASFR